METENFEGRLEQALVDFGAGTCNGIGIGMDPLGAVYSYFSGKYDNTVAGEGIKNKGDPFKNEVVDRGSYSFKGGKCLGTSMGVATQYFAYGLPQMASLCLNYFKNRKLSGSV